MRPALDLAVRVVPTTREPERHYCIAALKAGKPEIPETFARALGHSALNDDPLIAPVSLCVNLDCHNTEAKFRFIRAQEYHSSCALAKSRSQSQKTRRSGLPDTTCKF